eukprot:NODE_1203_length_582_cov_631.422139_g1129_i0.p1 GENE.NODE_1203_length_582_cov_631.422139_g1129_i0~~NODE_1203_length_582_cov_631.422139_g1129_i0.p1  ORF type:complete len:110 (-),score=9.69 NODE_1203_length_582_cov_631.422139_g1129_i0:187-516(-)
MPEVCAVKYSQVANVAPGCTFGTDCVAKTGSTYPTLPTGKIPGCAANTMQFYGWQCSAPTLDGALTACEKTPWCKSVINRPGIPFFLRSSAPAGPVRSASEGWSMYKKP